MMKKVFLIICVVLVSGCDTYDFVNIRNRCATEVVCTYSLVTIPNYPSLNKTEFYIKHSMNKDEVDGFIKSGTNSWKRYIVES